MASFAVCDYDEWYKEAETYAKGHRLTGLDVYDSAVNPKMIPLQQHIDKHIAEGAWNAGFTRNETVTV